VQLIAQDIAAAPRVLEDKQGGADVLLLPGLGDSPPRHWQSHWEQLSHCRRVSLGDWSRPRLHEWVPALDRAVRESARPVVLAAHSLGCLAAAWWASLCWVEAFRDKVRGALFVAPPDVDALEADPRIRDFRPLPRLRLPFRTILVASRSDPYAPYARSERMAACWGSELVDAGEAGHLNAESGLYEWTQGLRLLAGLSGDNPNLMVAELGLRSAMA
jgi:predicted alpha/beta hydrolase family esterase